MCWTSRALLPLLSLALLASIVLFTPAPVHAGDVALLPGGQHTWPISLERESRLSYDVEVGPGGRIDLLLMSAAELGRFEAGGSLDLIEEGSFHSVSRASADLMLLAGDYCLLAIDRCDPGSPAVSEVRISISIGPDDARSMENLKVIMEVGIALITLMLVIMVLDILRGGRETSREGRERL